MTQDISLPRIDRLRDALLRWYDRHRRDLPWRQEREPYRIWVSEVMLQQTRVSTVETYYPRFLERFPTVAHLAAAPVDDVLKAWEGLGYYARARNLHAAARQLVERYAGKLPGTYKELRRLPGLGDYAAGAVASIAFGEAVPAVDGNVKRVLARLFAVQDDIGQAATLRHLRQIAQSMVSPQRPGDFNQALMELGSLICLPVAPRCLLCPLRNECRGLALGVQESLPLKTKKLQQPHYDTTAGVIRGQDGRLLVDQRYLEGMLGGLWEFPGGRCQAGESLPDCLERAVREKLGIRIEVGQEMGSIRHAYTHFRITLHVFECRPVSGEPITLDCADFRWVEPDNLSELAMPVTDQKILSMLAED